MSKWFLICLIVISACKQTTPPRDSIEYAVNQRFLAYLTDWYYLQELMKGQPAVLKDSLFTLANDALLKEHRLSKAELRKHIEEYQGSHLKYQELLDSLKIKIQASYVQ